jgi:hypothetical protein
MSNTVSSRHYGLESQRAIRCRPTNITFRDEWERWKPRLDQVIGLPMSVNGIPLMDKHCTDDEINELKMTDRIAVSTYIQGMDLKRIHIPMKRILTSLSCHFSN